MTLKRMSLYFVTRISSESCLDIENGILNISDSGGPINSLIGKENFNSCEWSGAVAAWPPSRGCLFRGLQPIQSLFMPLHAPSF
jgi:hypothetical protein